ncbi:MAG: YceI family protein [bacterium]|nr:YceI family protein [bacterium]
MKNRCINAILVALAIVVSASIQASAADFYVSGAPETDNVTFASDAKLEFIEGTTNAIVGVVSFDPANTTSPASGRIRVDAASLKTGIELRDEHMRERHLHTAQFPHIEFVLKSVSGLPAQLSPATETNLSISGDFSVHGKTLPITAPASVELLPPSDTLNQAILVTATFEIKLDDYGIPRPKMLLLKLAETIKIRVRFIASTSNPKVTL